MGKKILLTKKQSLSCQTRPHTANVRKNLPLSDILAARPPSQEFESVKDRGPVAVPLTHAQSVPVERARSLGSDGTVGTDARTTDKWARA